MTEIFTAAQRRSLERISGDYLHLTSAEPDFTLSDVFSLGMLLTAMAASQNRVQLQVDFYKSAYSSLCNALKIANPELFLMRLSNVQQREAWDDFSDFKAVWYPQWFENQMWLRSLLFSFAQEEQQKSQPDFWGAACSDENVKNHLLSVRDSFKQIRVGTLALVFKIDDALASLLGWSQNMARKVSWQELKGKFSFPLYKKNQ